MATLDARRAAKAGKQLEKRPGDDVEEMRDCLYQIEARPLAKFDTRRTVGSEARDLRRTDHRRVGGAVDRHQLVMKKR